jgi:hypothetical protein
MSTASIVDVVCRIFLLFSLLLQIDCSSAMDLIHTSMPYSTYLGGRYGCLELESIPWQERRSKALVASNRLDICLKWRAMSAAIAGGDSFDIEIVYHDIGESDGGKHQAH